jgi:hypothetical protein
MWRYLLADLHVHTVLSPCAGVEMIPPLIVQRARALGLDVLAITDHHAAHNITAVMEAAAGTDLTVLAGMEVQSREEAHLLCLFDTVSQVMAWQEQVFAALPDQENDEAYFGAQFVVNADGSYRATVKRLLAVSTALSVEDVVVGVLALGGIVLAAHVDRPSFSLIANLGFVPPGLRIAGIEISRHCDPAEAIQRWPQIADYGLVVGGDAHRLEEMTARTVLKVAAPTVNEIAWALRAQDGRRAEILVPSPASQSVNVGRGRETQEDMHGTGNH